MSPSDQNKAEGMGRESSSREGPVEQNSGTGYRVEGCREKPREGATPRTDAVTLRVEREHKEYGYRWYLYMDLARQLERELAEADSAIYQAAQILGAAITGEDHGVHVGDLPDMARKVVVLRSATQRTHDVLLAITHGYVEWEATGDFDNLVKAINEAEVYRQEIAPPPTIIEADVVPTDNRSADKGQG